MIEVSDPTLPSDGMNRALDSLARPFHRQLGWLWRRGFRFLFVIDAVVLYATMVGINVGRFGTSWPTYPLSHYWVGFAMATSIHLLVNYFAGLYEREPRLGSRPWLPRVALAMAIGVAGDGLVAILTDRYLMPRINLAVLLVVGSAVLTGTRYVSRRLANRRRGPARVVLVGSSSERAKARSYLERTGLLSVVAAEADRVSEVFGLVSSRGASDVLLLDLTAFSAAFPEPISALDRLDVGVHQRVSAVETLLGLRAVREISGIPFIRLHTHALASHQFRLKRLLDITTVAITLPVTLPLLVLVALYVRVVAGAGILFRQDRVGQGGRYFRLMKFRTMGHGAELGSGPRLSSSDDDRVLPGMRWLRSTRLDELPQLWNVVRGEMSIVGPRPERPELVAEIQRMVPGYGRRHEVPPGITGLAQVHGRYDTDAAHKLGYDLQYLVNWSLVLDLQIFARTIWVVMSGRV